MVKGRKGRPKKTCRRSLKKVATSLNAMHPNVLDIKPGKLIFIEVRQL